MSKELDYITELERKNRLLGERCNQLLKDKGDLTDQIADIKANCDLAIEGRDIKIDELEEKNSQMFNTIALQEQQIEQLREERNYFQETCEDIELNYYCDHKGVCKAQELEKEKCELLGIIQEKDKAIKKLIADIAGLEEDLEAEKKINEQIKVRFVRCNTCTEEMKSKCLMFSENLCEGERCEELVDLMSLINKE